MKTSNLEDQWGLQDFLSPFKSVMVDTGQITERNTAANELFDEGHSREGN